MIPQFTRKNPEPETKHQPKHTSPFRCSHCAEFRSAAPIVQSNEWTGKKAIHRICPIDGQSKMVDSPICDRFSLNKIIWCQKNDQWVHLKACAARFQMAITKGVRDDRCLVSCKVGREVLRLEQLEKTGGLFTRIR